MSSSPFPRPAARRSPNAARNDRPDDGRAYQYRDRDGEGRSGKTPSRGENDAPRRERKDAPHSGNKDASFQPRQRRSGEAPRRKQTTEAWEAGSAFDGAGPAPEHENPALLPGAKPVLELLESAPHRIDTVFLRKGRHTREMERIADICRTAGVRFSLLAPPAFARVYDGKSQGVVARLFEAGFVEYESLLDTVMEAPMPLLLALDQVQDPGNAGTLARTLYALGGAGLVVPRHNGAYLGAGAAKAAAGALERLPVAKAANLGQALDAAKDRGIFIYGAASGSRTEQDNNRPVLDIFDVTPRFPAVLVLGGEEGGLRPGVEKRCDALLRIPMLRDFDSLNVAQAGAVSLGWFSRFAAKTGNSSL